MSCNYCNVDVYIKTIAYAKPPLAPVTEIGLLRQKIEDATGEVYVMLPKRYCPMCGAELKGEETNEKHNTDSRMDLNSSNSILRNL